MKITLKQLKSLHEYWGERAERRDARAADMGFTDPDIMDVFKQNRPAVTSRTDWGTVMEMKERFGN